MLDINLYRMCTLSGAYEKCALSGVSVLLQQIRPELFKVLKPNLKKIKDLIFTWVGEIVRYIELKRETYQINKAK